MAYSSNKTPAELSELSALATNDTIIVGDTSDTAEVVKKITKENLLIDIASSSMTMTNKIITEPTITLKQSASPTPTAEGDIQWDTDDNKIVVGDGATAKTFVPTSAVSGDATMTTAGVVTQQNKVDLTAACTITAGNPVGVSQAVSGYVSKALQTSVTGAHGISSPVSTFSYGDTIAAIGGSKYVRLYRTTASTDTLFASVGTIDRDAQTITPGTPATVATAFTPGTDEMCVVAKLDTDKFIVFYLLDSSTTDIKYRVGTVSGTTVTFGSEATFVTAASLVTTSTGWSACQISTDKGVLLYKAATTTSSRAVAFTVSGTVVTAGTPVTLGANNTVNTTGKVRKIGTDKFVIVTPGSSRVDAQVGTISGTTITLGTEQQISSVSSGTSLSDFDVVSHTTDAFVVRYSDSTNDWNLVAATVSGTTMTAGTPIETTGTGGGNLMVKDSTTVWVTTGQNTSADRIFAYTVSGASLSLSGTVIYQMTSSFGQPILYMLDAGFWVVFVSNVPATNETVFIEGMSMSYIGFAQNSAARGETVAVKYAGVDSNQSGLSPGNIYNIADGVLNSVSIVDTAYDTPVEQYFVTAISPTQIII